MTKQKADAIYQELRCVIGATPTEINLYDAVETLRKAGEVLADLVEKHEGSPFVGFAPYHEETEGTFWCRSCGAESPRERQVKHGTSCSGKKLEAFLAEWEGQVIKRQMTNERFKELAVEEDGCSISVGGFVSSIEERERNHMTDQQRIADLERQLSEARQEADELSMALHTIGSVAAFDKKWLDLTSEQREKICHIVYVDCEDSTLSAHDARVRAECESLFAAMVRGLLEASDLASREDKHGIPSGILKHDSRVRAETLRAAVSDVCMGDFYSDTWAYGWMTCYDLFKGLADKAERGEWPEKG